MIARGRRGICSFGRIQVGEWRHNPVWGGEIDLGADRLNELCPIAVIVSGAECSQSGYPEDTSSSERYGFAMVEALAAFLLRLVGEEGVEGKKAMEGKWGI